MAAPIAMCLNQAYRRGMEHDATQHWHQTNTLSLACHQIAKLESWESGAAILEQIALSQREAIDRIHCLFQLSLMYVEQFGIPFEKRHAYRGQLFALIAGEHTSIDDAQNVARKKYAEQHGKGIPRTIELAIGGRRTE